MWKGNERKIEGKKQKLTVTGMLNEKKALGSWEVGNQEFSKVVIKLKE